MDTITAIMDDRHNPPHPHHHPQQQQQQPLRRRTFLHNLIHHNKEFRFQIRKRWNDFKYNMKNNLTYLLYLCLQLLHL